MKNSTKSIWFSGEQKSVPLMSLDGW